MVQNLSLIANSGIQTIKQVIEINPEHKILANQHFCEFRNDKIDKELDFAVKIPVSDKAIRKKILFEENKINENGELIEGFPLGNLLQYGQELSSFDNNSDQYYYSFNSSDLVSSIRAYENKWLPFPYFKLSNEGRFDFGPYAWCRVLFKEIKHNQKEDDYESNPIRKFEVIIAFDTSIENGDEDETYFTPKRFDVEHESGKGFSLCKNEDYLLLNFISSESNCGWVKEYLEEIYEPKDKKDKTRGTDFGYLSRFLFLIKYLGEMEGFYSKLLEKKNKAYQNETEQRERSELKREIDYYQELLKKNTFPNINLLSENHDQSIGVSLVLDMGNANTCGLLFEHSDGSNFDLKTVKKLEIKDLSVDHFGAIYNDPFSMRLVFAKANFGQGKINHIDNYPNGPNRAFRWPSLVRVGKEARRLINLHNINKEGNQETLTNSSSPKRYLWDDKPSPYAWEFVNNELPHRTDAIYHGISEQFQNGGDFSYEPSFNLSPNYSRRSLMTFVYLEIFLHALSQINSPSFRSKNSQLPRKLKRVIITCPTSVVRAEQIFLRQCAKEAAFTLKRFHADAPYSPLSINDKTEFEIIPDPLDIAAKRDSKKHWNFDEATCSQLVFLYSEVAKKYLGGNNTQLFFETFGKTKGDQKSLTIASLDIGGGTTDLMICSYEALKNQKILPTPKFWESFNLAGDDLLNNIIQSVLLEGETIRDQNLLGIIKKYATEINCSDVTEKMRMLFGTDQAEHHPRPMYRKNINTQILIPIALRFLEESSTNKNELSLTYDDLFSDYPPNEEIINYINKHFGGDFNFKQITWIINHDLIEKVIRNVFERLFMQIAILMAEYQCDYVLVSGKLTSFPVIRNLFVEFYPVSPDRIITLNQYYAGDWYSFSENGNITDSKTIVPFGAIIALMGGFQQKLEGLSLDVSKLKEINSTADFIGKLNRENSSINNLYLKPGQHEITRPLDKLPLSLGYKQFSSRSYPAKPIYTLDFKRSIIAKQMKQKHLVVTEEELEKLVDEEYTRRNNSIDDINITRNEYPENKEKIDIEIIDENGTVIEQDSLELRLMTLQNARGYWADTGEFELFRS